MTEAGYIAQGDMALPERHHHLIPMNEDAIRRGMEIIKTER